MLRSQRSAPCAHTHTPLAVGRCPEPTPHTRTAVCPGRFHRTYSFILSAGLGPLFRAYAESLDYLVLLAWDSLASLRTSKPTLWPAVRKDAAALGTADGLERQAAGAGAELSFAGGSVWGGGQRRAPRALMVALRHAAPGRQHHQVCKDQGGGLAHAQP